MQTRDTGIDCGQTGFANNSLRPKEQAPASGVAGCLCPGPCGRKGLAILATQHHVDASHTSRGLALLFLPASTRRCSLVSKSHAWTGKPGKAEDKALY